MTFGKSLLVAAGMIVVGVTIYSLLPDDAAVRMGAILGMAIVMGGVMRRYRVFGGDDPAK